MDAEHDPQSADGERGTPPFRVGLWLVLGDLERLRKMLLASGAPATQISRLEARQLALRDLFNQIDGMHA